MSDLLYFVLGIALGFCLLILRFYSEFPALVRYVIASQLLAVPSPSRNEQLLNLFFFDVLNPAIATDELIDHVQKKLEERDARLTIKCFTSMGSCLNWDGEFLKGRSTVPLADLELELNDMPEEYQEDFYEFIETVYERLEIKKQGGEFATKESYKKSGSLRFIWTREEHRLRLEDDREEFCDGTCDMTDKMEKGLSNCRTIVRRHPPTLSPEQKDS
ncbi:hypothetical protein BTUL_0071g00150 [Botrytis tulipae]|uniref:Uncharacterized protein n=1 Tax=Botrytis tulipae TaxID=87230 RepID=A0A4Z1EQZ6_9HELO|nr:hypothetical protein BTUL_0071g00150 [Botrytis tulipae]